MKKYKILLWIGIIGALIFEKGSIQTVASETAERRITAIELPQNLNFYLDPENENGRGQIYSSKYMIRNAGEEEVTFSIDMSLVRLDSQSSIEFRSEEWDAEPLDRSIYMYVVFEKEQEKQIHVLSNVEEPCEEELLLAPAGQKGDTAYISFGGMLSRSEDWKSGELAVNALYAMSVENGEKSEYKVKIDGWHIRIEYEEENLTTGESVVFYLVPDEGYSLPARIQVYVGGQEAEFLYDAITGKISLEKITGDVVVSANGITKASLPVSEIINEEEMFWSWTAEEGIQAYEYIFLQDDTEISRGRIAAESGSVVWSWSEGLENGDYQLCLRAIGDNIHCLNSEKEYYSVRVNRELLKPTESPGQNGEERPQPSDDMEEEGTPQPSDDAEREKTPQPSDIMEGEGTPQPSVDVEEQRTPQPQPSESTEKENIVPSLPADSAEEDETSQASEESQN